MNREKQSPKGHASTPEDKAGFMSGKDVTMQIQGGKYYGSTTQHNSNEFQQNARYHNSAAVKII